MGSCLLTRVDSRDGVFAAIWLFSDKLVRSGKRVKLAIGVGYADDVAHHVDGRPATRGFGIGNSEDNAHHVTVLERWGFASRDVSKHSLLNTADAGSVRVCSISSRTCVRGLHPGVKPCRRWRPWPSPVMREEHGDTDVKPVGRPLLSLPLQPGNFGPIESVDCCGVLVEILKIL